MPKAPPRRSLGHDVSLGLLQRDGSVDEPAQVTVAVAQVDLERARGGREPVDFYRGERDRQAVVDSLADDSHRLGNVVEGNREDLRRVEIHSGAVVPELDVAIVVVL